MEENPAVTDVLQWHPTFFLIQIIVTSRLSEENNLWLKNLTNNLKNSDSAQRLLEEYGKHKDNKLRGRMGMVLCPSRGLVFLCVIF